LSKKKIPFNVSARTAMLIGRENVNNAKSAAIELIKNTYDADSKYCIVVFDCSNKNEKDNKIYIIDNGEGMDSEVISTNWMTIGTDNKQYDFISKGGRIKSGAKGIGRFALDRLGGKCRLITKREGHVSYEWTVNWSDFESGKRTIDNVHATLEDLGTSYFSKQLSELEHYITDNRTINYIRKFKNDSGTIIEISELRDNWTPNSIKSINESLNTLIPPSNISDYKLFMYSPNYPEKLGQVKGELADDFDYRVICKYEKNENLKFELYRNEFVYDDFPKELTTLEEFESNPYYDKKYFDGTPIEFSKTVLEVMNIKTSDLQLSEVLNGFTCEINFLKRTQSQTDMKKYFTTDIRGKKRGPWLDTYGGIKLFRDNFKVRPYGEANTEGFDWLNLARRAEKSPAAPSHESGQWRVRSKQIQGVVNISRTTNKLFIDQANREGIQESEEFTFFKNLLTNIIKELERDRQSLYRLINENVIENDDKEQTKKEGRKLAKKITKKKSSAKTHRGSQSQSRPAEVDSEKEKLAQAVAVFDEENVMLRDEIRTLQALATTGLIINTLSHEIKDSRILINKRIEKSNDILTSGSINEDNWSKLRRNIEVVAEKYKSLNEMFTMTLDVIKKDKRRRKAGSLVSFMQDISKSWDEILGMRRISFRFNFVGDHDYRLRFFFSDLETILNNLIINSIEAFEDPTHTVNERIIKVNISNEENNYHFTYSDNGPGLSKHISDVEVFTPHETTKKDPVTGEQKGTGLGMWIVKTIIEEYSGESSLIRNDEGFKLEFTLKKNLRRRN